MLGTSMLVERVSAKPPMLGAMGNTSERERVRETSTITNEDEDTEKKKNKHIG